MKVHTFIVNYFIDLCTSQVWEPGKVWYFCSPIYTNGFLTFAVRCYKTFCLCVVSENSPILYKRITYTMYAVGKSSPMTWTQ